jgi:AraC-like DNA-binding protein
VLPNKELCRIAHGGFGDSQVRGNLHFIDVFLSVGIGSAVRQARQPFAAIVSAPPAAAEHLHVSPRGVSVGFWQTSEAQEISAEAFDALTVCIQLESTSGICWVDGRVAHDGVIRPGAWQAHSPGQTFHAVSRSGCDLMRIAFPQQALTHLLTDHGIEMRPGHLEVGDGITRPSALLLQLARELKRVLIHGPEHDILYAETLLTALSSHLLVAHSNASDRIRKNSSPEGRLSALHFARVHAHMMEHLETGVRLDDLAACVGLTPFHFSRLFKARTGLSPYRYYTLLRVRRAAELLAGTRTRITDIAHSCGFSSSQHMAAVFRRVKGCSPSSYRERLRR